MSHDKVTHIWEKCPWCGGKQRLPLEEFEEWDVVGNYHTNGDTFGFFQCKTCSEPFWVKLNSYGKSRSHRLTQPVTNPRRLGKTK